MKYSTKDIFYKALFSSLAGLPVSMILNQILIHWITEVVTTNVSWLAAVILSIPFVIASIVRIFIIDWAYHTHNINVSPEYLLGKLIKATKCKLKHA